MVILLFMLKRLGKILPRSSFFFYTYTYRRNKSRWIFPNRFSMNKSVTIRCRIKFCTNGPIFMDGNSFIYIFLYNSLLRGASFSSIDLTTIHRISASTIWTHVNLDATTRIFWMLRVFWLLRTLRPSSGRKEIRGNYI